MAVDYCAWNCGGLDYTTFSLGNLGDSVICYCGPSHGDEAVCTDSAQSFAKYDLVVS